MAVKKEKLITVSKQRFFIAAVFLIFAIGFGAIVSFEYAYAHKAYPGVRVGYLAVGGMTKEEITKELSAIEDNIQQKGFVFQGGGKEVSVNPVVISTSSDLAKTIVSFDGMATAQNAFAYGRGKNSSLNLVAQLSAALSGHQAKIVYELNDRDLQEHLQASFDSLEKQPANASLVIRGRNVSVKEEQSGYLFDYEKATLEEVGQDVGLTRERVRQIQMEALKALRKILDKNGLTAEV